jgi:hypothetical protein
MATVQPAPAAPVDAVANLRRSMFLGAGLGVASIIVLTVFGHPLMGVFGCVGLALGALNNRMLQRAVLNYGADETIPKGAFSRKVLVRLGLVTLLAVGCALITRPDGLGVFAGLAVFQLLMLVGATVPVMRSLRSAR